MMRDIVEKTRSELSPFIGDTTKTGLLMMPSFEQSESRFVRKIPRKNYDDLPNLIPISWL